MGAITTELYVGLDIGTSYLHYAVIDASGIIIYSSKPILHQAQIAECVEKAIQDVLDQALGKVVSTAFTGSLACCFGELIPGLLYRYDTVAIPVGAYLLNTSTRFLIHLGAKDQYFFEIETVSGSPVIREWRTGTKCGGGSGLLIEKQCRRLFADELYNSGQASDASAQARLEAMLALACKEAATAANPSEFLARCGVVIQSDLIHRQNEGVTRADNLAGLFRTVARNYCVDVIGTRQLSTSVGSGAVVATGGVIANNLVLAHLSELLGCNIIRPEHFWNVAAIGVAEIARQQNDRFVVRPQQAAQAVATARSRRATAPPLHSALDMVEERSEALDPEIKEGTEVVIGIDGGSTTTKAAMVEVSSGRLLDKIYIKTHGDPEGALKKVLGYLERHKDKVVIKGVGATGSARKLYEKILISQSRARELASKGIACVDRITDEITCHALGVRHYDPQTDTIFEIGGQDMKFTRFARDGTVKEAKMNYSCQAGSGQTLENMAELINLKVESSLQEESLKADLVPIIDSTCGVFMEMDQQRLLAEGFSRQQIAAAIIRGTAASYFYKFVGGSQNIGKVCSAQGGPALGKAFLAALAQVTGARIKAYPHREIFGAWGQALDIIQAIRQCEQERRAYGTAFRGWDVINTRFEKTRQQCRQLFGVDSCGMRDCQLEVFNIDNDMIVSGGFCPRGDWQAGRAKKTDYVKLFHRLLDSHFNRYGLLFDELEKVDIPKGFADRTIGIKRSTATLGPKAIWAAALLRELGFLPVLSPVSNDRIATIGVDRSRTEFCIARKLSTGHAAVLWEHPMIRYLFNPSFIEIRQPLRPDLKYCIYTETEGFVMNDVLSLDKSRQLNPIIHLDDRLMMLEQIRVELARIGITVNPKQIGRALDLAAKAEEAFLQELYEHGDRFLAKVEEKGARGYIGLGRDYVLLDPQASSDSGAMFSSERCLDYIPQIFLEHRFQSIDLEGIAENEYWVESVKILKAGIFVANHPNLFGIRLMNFACGPDSLKVYQERRIQEAANKPLLVLVTDAQTNNAPFVTRTEAHERVVNQCKPRPLDQATIAIPKPTLDAGKRVWLIPFMGNASYIGAAGLRHFGIESVVLPTNTPAGYELARKHIWTEVCYPLKGVLGDVLGFLRQQVDKDGLEVVRSRYLVMLPTTSGPCRFGKYTEMVRHFLEQEGLGDIPVVGPSSENDYIDIPFPPRMGFAERVRFQQVLFKGIYAADLLEDAFLRFRPYALDTARINQVRAQQLEQLVSTVAAGADMDELVRWARRTLEAFSAVPAMQGPRFPLVLYIGEIYMRQHDPYTGFVIDKLEQAGLEVVRDPVTGWLQYVNQTSIYQAARHIRLGLQYRHLARVGHNALPFIRSLIKGRYMSSVVARLSAPFHKVLEGRHVLPEPMEMLRTLELNHECHRSIEGESPISTAIAYYLMRGLVKQGPQTCIAGVFHVGPFTCMQETVATAKIEAMLKEYRKHRPDVVLPVIHAFFGDSPNPNLEAEIAVFRQQCYQRLDLVGTGGQAVVHAY